MESGGGPRVLVDAPRTVALSEELHALSSADGAQRLKRESDEVSARALALLDPGRAADILERIPSDRRERIFAVAPGSRGEEWRLDIRYPETSVGRLMEKPVGVFRPETTVAEAVQRLRELVQRSFITYVFVTDAQEKLVGVLAFRELLFASPQQRLEEIMLLDPFSLRPETPLVEAMRSVVTRHFPAYPVTDDQGRLIGMVRGQALFERQAYEISAQAGSMVGVEKEERVATHWWRSFRFRHPWLQLNLLTAFLAAAVVGVFQGTVDRIVVLAAFLPVLAGQSGNSGCQALAVTLRGITLGDMKRISTRKLVLKEAWVGVLNGLLVGLVAGLGMWFYAHLQHNPRGLILGLCVWFAMTASCAISGIAGTLVPLILQRLGADPATASSIFLTTATDCCSMGLLLALATVLVK